MTKKTKKQSISLDKVLAKKTYIEEKDALKSRIQYMLNNGVIVPLTYRYKSSRQSKSFFVIYRGNNKEMCIEMISLLHLKINKKLDKLKYKIFKYDKTYILYLFIVLKKRERIVERESWFISYDTGHIEPSGTYSFTRKECGEKKFFLKEFNDYKELENEEDIEELKEIKRDKVRRIFLTYTKKGTNINLTKEIINDFLLNKFGCIDGKENKIRIAISKEKHKDGSDHYHTMMISTLEITVRVDGEFDKTIFDIKVSEDIYHPNIRTFNDKSQKTVLRYALKEDREAFINMDMMRWMIKQDSDKLGFANYLIRKFTILGISNKKIKEKMGSIDVSLYDKSEKISKVIEFTRETQKIKIIKTPRYTLTEEEFRKSVEIVYPYIKSQTTINSLKEYVRINIKMINDEKIIEKQKNFLFYSPEPAMGKSRMLKIIEITNETLILKEENGGVWFGGYRDGKYKAATYDEWYLETRKSVNFYKSLLSGKDEKLPVKHKEGIIKKDQFPVFFASNDSIEIQISRLFEKGINFIKTKDGGTVFTTLAEEKQKVLIEQLHNRIIPIEVTEIKYDGIWQSFLWPIINKQLEFLGKKIKENPNLNPEHAELIKELIKENEKYKEKNRLERTFELLEDNYDKITQKKIENPIPKFNNDEGFESIATKTQSVLPIPLHHDEQNCDDFECIYISCQNKTKKIKRKKYRRKISVKNILKKKNKIKRRINKHKFILKKDFIKKNISILLIFILLKLLVKYKKNNKNNII